MLQGTDRRTVVDIVSIVEDLEVLSLLCLDLGGKGRGSENHASGKFVLD